MRLGWASPTTQQKVVDAIVWVAVHPREELPVGSKARTTYVFHHLFPDVTERVWADLSRREIEMGAPAPPTSGALYAPTPEGRTVEGGLRERMKEEDAARRR